MTFWEFNFNTFDAWIYLGIITIIFLLSNTIRRKVKFIKNSLLPTAIIAGLIILIIKSFGVFDLFLNMDDMNLLMESITYHALGFGVIALSLKNTPKQNNKNSQKDILNSGLVTVNTYLIQGIVGILVTLGLGLVIKNLIPASGLLLPIGFGQGSGQALSFGKIFEESYGFMGGASFGLMLATIGFLISCLVGVVHINVVRRKNKGTAKEQEQFISTEVISSPNEVPITDAVDRMSIQIGLIMLVYFLTFLFMYGIELAPLGNFGTNTLKPLIWGFNFLIGSLFAVLLKTIFKKLQKKNIMVREYPNNYLLNRISGFSFDIMIVAGTAAISISVLKSLIIPLLILGLAGTIVTYVYVKKLSYKLFPNYKEEAFLSLFGMLTGTTSTGMILLREVDPGFTSPASSNLVYQSFYAIAFGFPLFLLLGIAPKGLMHTLIALGIIVVMFIAFNILLFRDSIFKKKVK